MIAFELVMSKFSDVIQDIYCCDCLFETVLGLVSFEKFSKYDEFIEVLERKFPKKYLFISFNGVSALMCKDVFNFISSSKKKHEPILKPGCITDYIIVNGESVVICVACVMKIIITNGNFLKHFRLADKYRSNVRYLYL